MRNEIARFAVMWRRLLPQALAVEMETSALFVMGTLRKIATASILVLDGNPRRWEEGVYQPSGQAVSEATDGAILAALETLAGTIVQPQA